MRPLPTLKQRREFQRLTHQGSKWVTQSFILQGLPSLQTSQEDVLSRVGYTVSRKVGPAVVRNKVKRRLKEAVRLVFNEQERIACDYVLIARREARTKKFLELVEELRWALKHLRRLLEQR